ncbi:MAG: PTS sugar transporter subunit IIA [Elusimicrobia bacterium]|nr:PTS sugar transporter subunit IIA [Elusimicrobiota bacterium]
MVHIIVVTHGEFGAYLVEAAEEIVGLQGSGVRCVSISARLSVGDVEAHLRSAAAELRAEQPDASLLILVDIPGGTPCNIAMRILKDDPNVRVVCGVNLYMLVTAFSQRAQLSLEELAERVISAGQRAIVDMKTVFAAMRN